MARWKPLPGDLEPLAQELVVQLRELKDQVGITTAALATKTAYSRSSWERYLNGKALPPRYAVEALARLAGADLPRVVAAWELAQQARAAVGGQPAPEVTAAPPRPRRRLVVPAAAGAVFLVALGFGVLLAVRDERPSPSPVLAAPRPAAYSCTYARREGRLYAGHSTTSERLLLINSAGPDVVEAQCLLARRGYDPGPIDGIYGPRTEQAVKALQQAGGAVVDGIVGPQTWALLRA